MTNRQHRRRRTLAVAVFALAVVVPSFAGALELDSVTDVIEPVADAVEPVTEVVDPVTDTVTDVVDPVLDTGTDPVRDVVGTVTETVADPVTDVVGPVTDTVPDPLPDGPSVIDDPAVPTGSGVATNGNRGVFSPASAQGRNEPAARAGMVPRDLRTAVGLPLLPGAGAPAGAATAQRSIAATAGAPEETPLATAGRVVREAVEAFRFPLLVGAAVLLFLAVQSRLDRRDPKLAAPAADEERQFA